MEGKKQKEIERSKRPRRREASKGLNAQFLAEWNANIAAIVSATKSYDIARAGLADWLKHHGPGAWAMDFHERSYQGHRGNALRAISSIRTALDSTRSLLERLLDRPLTEIANDTRVSRANSVGGPKALVRPGAVRAFAHAEVLEAYLAVEPYVGILPPADILQAIVDQMAVVSHFLSLLVPNLKTAEMEAEIAGLEANAREYTPFGGARSGISPAEVTK